jgi:8-oxo-dGTP diphosphatase
MAATGVDPLAIVPIVSAALVDERGRVLLQQRPQGKAMAGLWEFPGGKIASGETPERALCRELEEELGITVAESDLEAFGFASHRYDTFHILLLLYLCRRWQGTPRPRETQALDWTSPSRMSDYPMPPADAPLVTLLQQRL